ncbi:MAG: hypothetical protein OEM26_10055 [Saprospiraceae bacterium]|nr:hypothetical protein [Saprospiraceae bacterium]
MSLAFSVNSALAQYNIQHYSIDDGLGSNLCRSITQDKLGYIWVNHGPYWSRFDGYSFTVISSDSTNARKALYRVQPKVMSDPQGNLWFVPDYGFDKNFTMGRYDVERDSFISYETDIGDVDIRTTLIGAKVKVLWLGAWFGSGLFRYDIERGEVRHLLNPHADTVINYRQNSIRSIVELDSFILLGTGWGVWLMDKVNYSFSRPDFNPLDSSLFYHSNFRLHTLPKLSNTTNDSSIWLQQIGWGSDTGMVLVQVDPDFSVQKTIWFPTPSNIFLDGDGMIWLTSITRDDPELKRYNPDDSSVISFTHIPGNPLSLLNSGTRSSFVDREGNIWIGTHNAGLTRIKKQGISFEKFRFQDGYIRGSALMVGADGPALVLPTEGQPHKILIGSFDRSDKLIQPAHQFTEITSGTVIYAINQGRNYLWVCTAGSATLFGFEIDSLTLQIDPNPKVVIEGLPQFPQYIWEDEYGNVWIPASAAGLCVVRNPAGEPMIEMFEPEAGNPFAIRSGDHFHIMPEEDGTMWVVSSTGMDRFYPDEGRFEHIYDGAIVGAFRGEDGTLYLGTDNALIEGFQDNNRYKFRTLLDGVREIFSISEDLTGKIWFRTEGYVGIYDKHEGSYFQLGQEDGITFKMAEYSRFYPLDDGKMILVDREGVTLFHTRSLQINRTPNPPVFTDLSVNHQDVLLRTDISDALALSSNILVLQELTLDHRSNNFSLGFSAMQMAAAKDIRYRYKLGGYDNKWIEVDHNERIANYMNLSQGQYTFRVKASSPHGLWTDEETTLKLQILPPPWKTWWAYTLYGLFTISVFWIWYRWRTRNQRQKLTEQLQLNTASSRFVPSAFLNAIGRKNILEVQLGDLVEREVTVLFSDIRDFTTISENMTPEENFQFVNAYSRQMGPVIQKHNGFVNQYLGDGIMAIFPEKAEDALYAAIGMEHMLRKFNVERVDLSRQPIQTGMGLHSGSLIMGILGDEKRLDAATISDTVNTASRIEGLTKYYHVKMILSEDTLHRLDPNTEFNLRYLGKVQVKGKKLPLNVYESLDVYSNEQKSKRVKTKDTFEMGIMSYLSADFKLATGIFQNIITSNAEDKTAFLFYEKSKEFMNKGAPDGWMGIEEVTFK